MPTPTPVSLHQNEAMFTPGRRLCQPAVNGGGKKDDRLLSFRWMAILLQLSPNISSHIKEFEQVLLLPLA